MPPLPLHHHYTLFFSITIVLLVIVDAIAVIFSTFHHGLRRRRREFLIISAILVVVVILIIGIINDIGPCYPTLSFVISDIIALHTKLISSRPIKRVIFQLIQSIVMSERARSSLRQGQMIKDRRMVSRGRNLSHYCKKEKNKTSEF